MNIYVLFYPLLRRNGIVVIPPDRNPGSLGSNPVLGQNFLFRAKMRQIYLNYSMLNLKITSE